MEEEAEETIKWEFSQRIDITDSPMAQENNITAVRFTPAADYLAVGTQKGSIKIYQESESEGEEIGVGTNSSYPKYKEIYEMNSHSPYKDSLTSLDIQARIMKIIWMNNIKSYSHPMLLECNEKTVKLWKLGVDKPTTYTNFNLKPPYAIDSSLSVRTHYTASTNESSGPNTPSPTQGESILNFTEMKNQNSMSYEELKELLPHELRVPFCTARSKVCKLMRTYDKGHPLKIHSISLCSDEEHFLTADEVYINLWNLNITNEAYRILHFPYTLTDDPELIITSACFHPKDPNLLLYSSSEGDINLGDLRTRSSLRRGAIYFKYSPPKPNFFTDILSHIFCAKFTDVDSVEVDSPSSPYTFYAKEYTSIRIWDIRANKEPLISIPITDYLVQKLLWIYENDLFYDKFHFTESHIGKKEMLSTGAYGGLLHISDTQRRERVSIPLDQEYSTGDQVGLVHKVGQGKTLIQYAQDAHFKKKVLCVASTRQLIAGAFDNSLVMLKGRYCSQEPLKLILQEPQPSNIQSSQKTYVPPTWRIV